MWTIMWDFGFRIGVVYGFILSILFVKYMCIVVFVHGSLGQVLIKFNQFCGSYTGENKD